MTWNPKTKLMREPYKKDLDMWSCTRRPGAVVVEPAAIEVAGTVKEGVRYLGNLQSYSPFKEEVSAITPVSAALAL